MKELSLKINISDEAFELLKYIKNNGNAEYRNSNYETVNVFLNSDDYKIHGRSLDWFNSRNANGSLYLIDELLKYELVDINSESWHQTWVLSDIDKLFIEQNIL